MIVSARPAVSCSTCRGRPKSIGGFTLVEVVVALVILSLIMLATITALRTFGNTQVTLTKTIDRVDEVRTISGFLRDTLEASIPGADGDSGLRFGGAKPVSAHFNGSEDSFEWVAYVLFGESYGGAMLLRVSRDGNKLVLQWQRPPVPIESAKWKGQPSRVLVEGLQDLQVTYHKEANKLALKRWSLEGTPSMVSMNIKARGRYWPELIVRLPR